MTKILPRELTSYDFLKMAAVLLMVADHIGYYFYPEENWWRVAGRLCVPMWFFLIGYAHSRDLGLMLWGGGALLILANLVTGMALFPLNILVTILIVRMMLNPVMAQAIQGRSQLFALSTLFLLLALPTGVFTEYGTLAVMLAMYGYMLRHSERFDSKLDYILPFASFLFLSFIATQYLTFGFNDEQMIVLSAGTAIVLAGLYFFRLATFPRLTAALPGVMVTIIQLFGRRTLEIYVLHLLLFKFLAVMSGQEGFGWFDPRLLNWGEG